MKKNQIPTFSKQLLHPKYWPVWAGFGLLCFLNTVLSYKAQLRLGRGLGALAFKLAPSRAHIARRNLELSFPDMPTAEVEALVVENFKNAGLAIFETGMAWFWPDWRIQTHFTLTNTEQLLEFERNKKGVLVVCVHTLNLELTARAFSLFAPGAGVYRPHSNPAYDFIQYWGRTRGGNTLLDRRDMKGMLRILKQGKRLWYLPDHDYGHHNSVFVPFFAVKEACTTTGTSFLVDLSRCAIVTASGYRDEHGNYELLIDDAIHEDFPRKQPEAAASYMNRAIEKVILRGMGQYMWLHKRFKSRPHGIERNALY